MNRMITLLAILLCLLPGISSAAGESSITPTEIKIHAEKPILEAGMCEDTFTSSSNQQIYYTLRIPENMSENMPMAV